MTFSMCTSQSSKRIQQGHVSTGIGGFEQVFLNKFELDRYHDRSEPAFFFGCYQRHLLRKNNPNASPDNLLILRHRSLAVVIWGGTDIQTKLNWWLFRPTLRLFRLRSDSIKHLAISDDIARDLERAQLPYQRIRFSLANPVLFTPRPLGSSVYIYAPAVRAEIYGKSIYEKVIAARPDTDFIISSDHRVPHEKMPEVYGKCFIGLRLTTHDGNANTVQEMGLMGIRCVHNGDMPNAIPWSSAEDVLAAMDKEQGRIGTVQKQLAEETSHFLQGNDDWQYMDFYS